ncbi:MAG: hypothetical protein M0P69_21410 [Bacteroidales bacterium]|nr:hypothetical protein [Bacteroidales bacterium]
MNEIKFEAGLVKRLNETLADAGVAVAEAALSAVGQNSKVTVRVFATALRTVAPMLGTSNCVLAAAIKAAKEKNAELNDVTAAMAAAADKKRRDDARRAADKRDAQPAKALQKALAEVEECRLAMRTPLEVAQAEVAQAEARVKEVCAVLREERAKLRKARAKLAEIEPAEQKEQKEQTEQAA